MDPVEPEPTVFLVVIQLAFFLLYALLSAAESAAQQICLSHRRAANEEDDKADKTEVRAQALMASPSGIRVCMMLLAMLNAGILMWQLYSLVHPLQGAGQAGTGFDIFSLWILLGCLVLVFLMQLLSVVLPRRFAAYKPRSTARFLFPVAYVVERVFRPFAFVLDRLSLGILRLFGMDVMLPTQEITEDEIRMMVDVGEEKGAIEEAEREMIKNVFEFNNMTAAECMTHRTDVYAVWIDDSNEEIIALIDQTGLSRFPVYEEDLDHIIGTLFTREFLLNLQGESPLPLRDIIREAHFVPETVRTDLLFRDMQRNKFHMAVVVDEYGGTSGLITMEDLLEEIVGNIYDEYDPQDQQEYEQLCENRWRVAGTLDVETFNELSGQSLPVNDEYDTIGGLILSQMSSIPEDGSQPEVTVDGLNFKVESVAGRRIEWVEVSKPDGV